MTSTPTVTDAAASEQPFAGIQQDTGIRHRILS
jgi:hypothetical protein